MTVLPRRFYLKDEDYAKLKELTDKHEPKTDAERVRILMLKVELKERASTPRAAIDYEEIRNIVRGELEKLGGF